ncbi:MAG: hypothetical protein Q8L55_03660 [Phycisphaerales bacterium]|nr:hypothetical protein [Phycisphaerales bacterium]
MSDTPAPQPATPGRPSLPPAAFSALAGGAIVVSAIIVLLVYAPVVSLLTAAAPPVVEPLSQQSVKAREKEFGDRIAAAAGKVVRRSPFHPPLIPEAPAPVVPTYYGGPSIVGVAGGAVYFADSTTTKRIFLGETIDGVEVIKIDAPWSVTLGWRGGKFEVAMLDRKPVSFDQSPMIKDTLFNLTPAGANAPTDK